MIRNVIVISIAITTLLSCKKSNQKEEVLPTLFSYASLVATDTVPYVNQVITLTATATGDGLSYEWSEVQWGTDIPYGSFSDTSGGSISWTVCHPAKFVITCLISDKYGNNASKSVNIHVK